MPNYCQAPGLGGGFTDGQFRATISVIGAFAPNVVRFGERIAIKQAGYALTYRELEVRSNQLARRLAHCGIKAGSRVGIALNRSADTIVTCLAVLKLGAAYLPLDPAYPPAAIVYMIEDATPDAVITLRSSCTPPLANGSRAILYLEDLLAELTGEDASPMDVALDGETPAYIMYTSGSTGKPKGVVVPHRGIVRLCCGTQYATFGPGDVILEVGPLAFDYSTLEIFGMLLTGGCVAVLPDAVPSLSSITEGIRREGATCLCLTPALFHLLVDYALGDLASINKVFTSGDIVSATHVDRFRQRYRDCALYNACGHTENTTFTTCYTVPALADGDSGPVSAMWGGGSVPIGTAITGSTVYVLDAQMQPVAPGATGSLWSGGLGVALGYLNRQDLTDERFKPDPFCGVPGALMYNTGDLIFLRPDGNYAFIGRSDRQVKVGGKRIELDAIEACLRGDPRVQDSAVVARTIEGGNKEIVAFVRTADPGPQASAVILNELAAREPAFMIPARLISLATFPVTPSGKIDRTRLAADFEASLALEAKPFKPEAGSEVALQLAQIWRRVLQRSPIDPEQNFFDLGGSSLRMIEVHALIEKQIRSGVAITDLFAHPTLASLTAFLLKSTSPEDTLPAARHRGREASNGRSFGGIAIVGMAGRFPGADNIAQLWDNLVKGVDSIRHFTQAELEDSFDAETRAADNFVKARSIIDGVDLFDAEFFSMQPREAALTDPQQRMFLELCWHVLEDAGCDPARYRGAIGVFAGSSLNTYFLRHVMANRAKVDDFTSNLQVGNYGELLGSLHDFLTTRVAYKLDLRGPAIGMQTACSTSLTAISEACKSLALFESDMALAGGVSLTFPQKRGYQHTEGGMVAADGVCRPFDADASGTVFGDGAAVVALKRLEDAVADGDHIYAVIKGWGLNNDGHSKIGFVAPSSEGQSRVIAAAHAMAGVEPSSIGYVECHGTATPLGDPIEFAGLEAAFAGAAAGTCWLGSAKGNVGHLDAAAGVTGLIKTALTLKHGIIPPLAHFKTPNPNIKLDGSPFAFSAQAVDWPRGAAPRRCGVSAFGVGGTNAHVVLEEAPALPVPTDQVMDNVPVILTVSARTPAALKTATEALAVHLSSAPDIALGDVAATLLHGRRTFACRSAVAAHTLADAAAKLSACGPARAVAADRPPVVFMFPGQGAQRRGMARALYDAHPVARDWIDQGLMHLAPGLRAEVSDYMLVVPETDDGASAVFDTRFVQPALFLTEHAIARAWESLGVVPDAMIGHSLGEFVAAVIAGVMTFENALEFIATRADLMQNIAPGAMTAVRLPEDKLRALLLPGIDIAAINAPNLCTVAGPFEAMDAFEVVLARDEIAVQRLRTSHAFHSAMMDPVVAPLRELAARAELNAPCMPCLSTVTGELLSGHEATDPGYWARHSRLPVRFANAARAARMQYPDAVFIEIGPGETLSALTAQVRDAGPARAIVRSLSRSSEGSRGPFADPLAEAVARLWAEGVAVDLARYVPAGARRVPLPLYPFERKRHWIDIPAAPVRETADVTAFPPAPLLNGHDISAPITTAGVTMTDARTGIETQIIAMLEELSGASLGDASPTESFFDLGYDSLFMAQIATKLQKTFKIKVTFRQLMRDYPTIRAVASLIPDQPKAPVAAVAPPAAAAPASTSSAPFAYAAAPIALDATSGSAMERVVRDQLAAMQQIMSQQLAVMAGHGTSVVAQPSAAPSPVVAAPAHVPTTVPVPPSKVSATTADLVALSEAQSAARFKVYGAKPAQQANISTQQHTFIADLTNRYASKSPKTKAYVQAHRRHLADPRSAAAFRADWKEMVFPVVAQRAKGSKLWDLDGNEYVDLVNGYGQTMFGHSPEFVTQAIEAQIREGFPIGPQTPLAGEVAERFARITGTERVTFCNTGSEAVMAAIRIARTVTGRDKIVSFAGDYHGQFDEVLVKAGMIAGEPGAAPICPGIPTQSVSNMIVLPYGHDASLAYIEENADDIAAVLVEPVQSRHPGLRPFAFLQRLREITSKAGTAMVMDEIVTGFRVGQAGAQGHFKIQGDMATYGKVVGGGMPIGVLAGKAAFMDALDSGYWSFGDDSVPEAAPTFFAGTFVRHPLVLAAARAVLVHLEAEGPQLYTRMEATTAALVSRLNAELTQRGIATRIEQFASFFYFDLSHDDRLGALFYHHMRLLGVHIQDGFPCFLTTAHSAADIAFIEAAFCRSLDALQAVGILAPADGIVPIAAHGEQPNEAALTEPQQEIYLIAQLGDKPSCIYNESITLTFSGPLDADAMRGAVADIVARHDAFRATFDASGETMRIAPAIDLDIALIDHSGEADPAAAFAKLLATDAGTAFDLEHGPLVRAMLVKQSATSHALVFTAHHLVCDGWSMGIVIKDLSALYSARRGSADRRLSEPASFLDYARTKAVDTSVDAAADKYWRAQYRDLPPPLELPTDRPRPNMPTYAGASATGRIGGDLQRQLKKAGARSNATMFAILFAAVQALTGRLTGNRDVVLAVPAGGQALLDESSLAGHLVNFLPVRAPFDFDEAFSKHLERATGLIYSALDHQDYTLGTLMRRLDNAADLQGQPLTRVQFNLERLGEDLDFSGLKTEMVPNPKSAVYFDLFFNFIEGEDGIRIDVDYSTELFDVATITRWIDHLVVMLEGIAANPACAIGDLPLLSPQTRDWLLGEANQPAASVSAGLATYELITAQVARVPDAVAVVFGPSSLTYRQLDEAATALAKRIAAAAPDAGERVALLVERSLDLPVAMLAAWKAGHAYLPLDPSQPAARLAQILDTGKPVAVVATSRALAGVVPAGVPIVSLDDRTPETPAVLPNLPRGRLDQAVAYVIFTSGTTGQPKGVEITHLGLSNVLQSVQQVPGFTAQDRMLAVSTIAFDVAHGEILLPLISGGIVEIAAAEDVRDGFALAKRLASPEITVAHATPSLWQLVVEAGFQPRPGLLMTYTGEPMSRMLADKLINHQYPLWNLYGPTEASIWASIDQVRDDGGPIIIKRPVANCGLYILDDRKHLAAPGIIGDVWIGGDGLAKGYFNRPDLTDAAFQTVTLDDGVARRLYRTGDVGRRRGDGAIILLGRSDHQVKLSGYRIELSEIEHVLRQHRAVADCAVAVASFADDDRRLAAYFVSTSGAACQASELSAHVAALLPAYMVPGLWKQLAALPLSANGKLDRKALPPVDRTDIAIPFLQQVQQISTQAPIVIPEPVIEPVVAITAAADTSPALVRQIAEVWADVLGVPSVPLDQPLLSLGARSLHLFRIAGRLQKAGLPVTARQLMTNPCVNDLVLDLDQTGAPPCKTVAAPSLKSFKRSHKPGVVS